MLRMSSLSGWQQLLLGLASAGTNYMMLKKLTDLLTSIQILNEKPENRAQHLQHLLN